MFKEKNILKEFIRSCLSEGFEKKKQKTRFYHASPKRFKQGDILTGGHEGGANTTHTNVCMTTSPIPHATITGYIPGWPGYRGHFDDRYSLDASEWYVYEVEPLYEPRYSHGYHEYQTRAAKVLRLVNKAAPILQKQSKLSKDVSVVAEPPKGQKRGFWSRRFHD